MRKRKQVNPLFRRVTYREPSYPMHVSVIHYELLFHDLVNLSPVNNVLDVIWDAMHA